ncbi:MAG: asparaginase [Cytophagales bacterium]|nr:asparaginase [Cytophagales bacterium]
MDYTIQNTRTSRKASDVSILIVYTGGTIGMVYDEEGSLRPFDIGHVLEKIPELRELDLQITVVSFPDPIDSSNVNEEDWKNLGQIIYENYNRYDGFVVLHGTDTMAYSASALSYMFDDLQKPIIFTGAQIPIGQLRSDARENMITALQIASAKENGEPLIKEVAIYFNFVLLRGNRAQKVRSSTFAAFHSENYPKLANSGIFIEYFPSNILKPKKKAKLKFCPYFDPNVVILKIFPGITTKAIKHVLNTPDLKGVVLETFGSGNTPNADWFLDLIKETVDKGVVVYNVSQCSGGEVIQGRYATSKKLEEIGVVSGGDITSEAAVTKLMHLLGKESDQREIKQLLKRPLRGEMDLQ